MSYPTRFGKYVLLEPINAGGMAEVFRAKTFGVAGFAKFVAIKRILPQLQKDTDFIKMFIDEARIAVQLAHPNIVQIHELGRHNQQLYIAMEFVAGMDLKHLLRDYRKTGACLPIPAAAYIACKICEGLDYAHRKTDHNGAPLNLIHRDISPQNILLSFEGLVKVTDFGIAKAENRQSQTAAGMLKGKFGYMSPEQASGAPIDARTDLFAVGILLYQMITGRHLFAGDNDLDTLNKVRNAIFISPRKYNRNIPRGINALLRKALAKKPEHRFQSASDFYDALQKHILVDGGIFDAKRLAQLLLQRYAAAIVEERRKLAVFSSVGGDEEDTGADDWQIGTEVLELGAAARGGQTDDAPSPGGDEAGSDWQTGAEDFMATQENTPVASGVSFQDQATVKSGPASLSLVRRRGSSWAMWVAVAVSGLVLLAVLGVAVVKKGLFSGSPSRGTLRVTSAPTAETQLFLDDVPVANKTPYETHDIPIGAHVLLAKATGFQDARLVVSISAATPAVVALALTPVVAALPADGVVAEAAAEEDDPAPDAKEDAAAAPRPARRRGCGGTGARLSILTHGAEGCEVQVGAAALGMAPLFQITAPVGMCRLQVRCKGGESYTDSLMLKRGAKERVVIQPSDWK